MQRLYQPFLRALLLGAAALTSASLAHADNFASVAYDARKDQLVVTMNYRGTNPNHVFTLQWGLCMDHPDGGSHDIAVEVLDSQWDDPARQPFTITTRFDLTDMNCRPAALTLRTAPRFYTRVQVPEKSAPPP